MLEVLLVVPQTLGLQIPRLGVWFYKKVDDVSTWASKKLGLKVLADEENWKMKYPNVSLKIDELEARINKLEKGDKYD